MTERQLRLEEFEALKAKRLAENPKYGHIASKLRQLFWDDSCNDVTIRFYDRLQDDAIVNGEPVYRCIKSVAQSAMVARNPVRYFAAAVCRRLHEQGFMQDGGDETGL